MHLSLAYLFFFRVLLPSFVRLLGVNKWVNQ